MKTRFFKKLSFVLALAMVLSIFAPAAGAFAAKAPTLNSKSKYLHLGRTENGQNEFNFNVNNKKKGWKYNWESTNTKVATVNAKNGVTTAKAAGTTKIVLTITDADGEELYQLTAKVTVRDNIETVKISNPVDTLAVGEEHDYNRSYVTEAGKTKGSGSVTRWTVEPATGATIDDKGVFKATEAGEFKVTARSFQSKAKYNSWLEDSAKYADYVLADDTTTVVVAGSMEGVKQVDLTKVNVTFNAAMDEAEVKENLKVFLLIGTAKTEQYVKSISLDKETSKVATVELYGEFNKGMTYVVEYPDMESKTFKAATTNYADVVRMTIDTKSVVATYAGGEEEEIEFTLYNAEDVDITDGIDADFGGKLADRVSFETESTGAYIYEGKKISIFEVGTVAEVKGTYNTYEYDEQGKEIGTVNAVAVIAGTKEATVAAGALNKYTVTLEDETPDWDKDAVTRVAIGADRPKLFAFVKDSDDKDIKSDDVEFAANFTFESSNDNVLFVSPDGDLYPVKEGTVVVVVRYGDVIVGYANITVVPESKAAAYTLSDYSFTLSTLDTVEDSKVVTVTLKDQYGNDAKVEDPEVNALTTNDSVAEHIEVDTTELNDKKITFTVKAGAVAGKAVYEVVYNGMKRTVTVTLVEPNHNSDITKVRYRLDLSKSIDLAVKEADDLDKKLDIKLIGYAPNGIKATKDVASTTNIEITGEEKGLVYNSDLYSVVSGGAITKIKTGTYKVVAKMDDKVVDTQYFTVSDTQKAPTYKVENAYYTAGSLEDIADECFDIKIDGKDHDGVLSVEVGYGEAGDDRIYIKEVVVKELIEETGSYLEHTVKVNLTVYKKK